MAVKKPLHQLDKRISEHFYAIAIALLGLACVAVVMFHLITLTRFPPIFIDESWYSNVVWNWLTTGENADTLHSGMPVTLRWPYLGNLPLLLSFALFDLGFFQARLVSWLFGVLLLLLTFIAGRQSFIALTGGLAALLLALSPVYAQASHYARPDIFLAATGMLSFILVNHSIKYDRIWVHFIAGLIIGVSIDIHQNALLYAMGLSAIYLYTYRKSVLRQTATWMFVAGGLVGVSYYLIVSILPNLGDTLNFYRFSFVNSHPIPVMSLNPIVLLESALDEIGRYKFLDNSLDFVLIGASIVYLLIRRQKADMVYLVFVGTVFSSFVLLAGNKHDIYAILLYPYFIIMVAEVFINFIRSTRDNILGYAFVLTVLALTIFSSAYHLARSAQSSRGYNYEAITDQIKQVIPKDARVVALPEWWLGMHDYDYKSILGLSFYNLSNGYNLVEGLEAIHPDILIVEDDLRGLLVDQGYFIANSGFDLYKMPRTEFQDFLSARGEMILDFRDDWHGRFQIYSINWDK